MDFSFFETILGAAGSLVGALATGFTLGRFWWPKVYKARLKDCLEKLRQVEQAYGEDEENVWHRLPIGRDAELARRLNRSIPVISIANLKGGVGKTTLASNLAAYFDLDLGKRVLLVDLDFQGSLSSLCLVAAGLLKPRTFHTNWLVEGSKDGEWLAQTATPLAPALPRSAVATCFYDFAKLENRLQIKWLMGRDKRDLRFNLAHVLTSNAVQSAFDLVILDLPPRVTTGFINALCASSHLLVPTILDKLSAEAVPTFLKQVRELKTELYPQLELLGVVPTMTANNVAFNSEEKEALAIVVKEAASGWRGDVPVFENEFIPNRVSISRGANRGLAYANTDAQPIFRRLGGAIAARLERAGAWARAKQTTETAA